MCSVATLYHNSLHLMPLCLVLAAFPCPAALPLHPHSRVPSTTHPACPSDPSFRPAPLCRSRSQRAAAHDSVALMNKTMSVLMLSRAVRAAGAGHACAGSSRAQLAAAGRGAATEHMRARGHSTRIALVLFHLPVSSQHVRKPQSSPSARASDCAAAGRPGDCSSRVRQQQAAHHARRSCVAGRCSFSCHRRCRLPPTDHRSFARVPRRQRPL